jgi:hypothetical protein
VEASGSVQRARQTPDASNDDTSTTGAKPLNPCMLVSMAEAQAITGGAVAARSEAPLGPTCVYTMSRARPAITLAIESQSFSALSRQLSGRKRVTVKAHRAYCGRLGNEVLFVPLAGGRVLNVTASCAIAQRFAVQALSRLSA